MPAATSACEPGLQPRQLSPLAKILIIGDRLAPFDGAAIHRGLNDRSLWRGTVPVRHVGFEEDRLSGDEQLHRLAAHLVRPLTRLGEDDLMLAVRVPVGARAGVET